MSLTDSEIAELRALLLARRDALLETAGGEAEAPVELDQSRVGRLSRMDALQGQAMSQAAGQRREQELARIAAALRRIESGSYGLCLRCDEDIAPARLRIDPAATLCIGCASKAEQPG